MGIETIKNHGAPFIVAGITAASLIKLLAGRPVFLIGCLIPATITPLVGTIIAVAAITLGTVATYFLTEKSPHLRAKFFFGIVTGLFTGTLLYGSFSAAVTITIPTFALSILFDSTQNPGIFEELFPTKT